MATVPEWWMKGDWFDVCSCDIACPCEFAQPPTGNHCDGVLVYHINEGTFGDAPLDDLNVIFLISFDGNFWAESAENVSHGLFIDDRGGQHQREALRRVFSGEAGGFIGNMVLGMGQASWAEFVPISFALDDDLAFWQAEIPGRVAAKAEALSGPTTPPGKRVQLLNPPGSETGPGQIATWGRATANSVDAPGFQWNWAEKSSKHIPFDWAGPT
jgi:hypothetical protein